MTGYIVLSNWDLALASILILIDAGLSVIFGLHIHRSLLVAALRMTVQLLLVGLVLTFLFTAVSPLWTGLCALVMILFAGHEVAARQERRLSGWWSYSLGTGCMMASSVLVTTFALLTALRPDPWYDPRYAIPLLGMILGNCMTGIALGLDTLTTGLMNRRDGVEARLMLGATRWQAARPVTRDALRSALMPIVNSMSATGVVSLPGMMTGQILSGVPPAEAVKYQILVMFLIAGGTGFGAVAAVIGGVYRLTDRRHRLRLDRLATVPASNAARQFCLALSLVLVTPAVASAEAMLTLECQIPLGIVSGRIDHLALDLQRKRLFIAELGNDSVERDRSLRRWASIHLSVSHLREVICPVSGSTLTGRRSAAIHGTPISSSRCSSRSVRTVRRRHRRTSHRSTTPNHRNVKPMSGFAVAGAAMRSAVEFARIPHAIGGLPSL